MNDESDPYLPEAAELADFPEETGMLAVVGAMVNLGAAFEPLYFRLYRSALPDGENEAARTFYGDDMTLGRRQQLTGRVVRPTLRVQFLSEWDDYWQRVTKATGRKGARNFLGHAPIRKRQGLFDPSIFDPAIFDTESLAAEQAKEQAELRGDTPRTEGFSASLDSYEELMGLYQELLALVRRYETGEIRGDP